MQDAGQDRPATGLLIRFPSPPGGGEEPGQGFVLVGAQPFREASFLLDLLVGQSMWSVFVRGLAAGKDRVSSRIVALIFPSAALEGLCGSDCYDTRTDPILTSFSKLTISGTLRLPAVCGGGNRNGSQARVGRRRAHSGLLQRCLIPGNMDLVDALRLSTLQLLTEHRRACTSWSCYDHRSDPRSHARALPPPAPYAHNQPCRGCPHRYGSRHSGRKRCPSP